MIEFKNKVIEGANKRETLFDARIPENAKAVIIFAHGYKGFKDWGCWNLMERFFLHENFGFVKFNFSHNGGTIENPIDFPDLEAFGNNCFSFELQDLNRLTSEVERLINQELALELPIYLMGHSRGGGVAVLHASMDKRIRKIVSLAGISNIGARFPDGEELRQWKEGGVKYVENARTKQSMPHYFTFYEDFSKNKEILHIQGAAEKLTIPFLQVHGDMDLTVSISEGMQLANWTNTKLFIVKGADHTFGASHPYGMDVLPEDFAKALKAIVQFFNAK